VFSFSGSHDLVFHMQYLRWYPHVQAWHRHVKRVIKHTDYTEYVGDDPAALPRSQWIRGSERAVLREKREEHIGFRHPRVVVDIGVAMVARWRWWWRTRRQHCVRRHLGFWCRRSCGGLGVGMWLGQPLGRPLAPFYTWPRPLGCQRPGPQVWTSSCRFPAKKTYYKSTSFTKFESALNKTPCPSRQCGYNYYGIPQTS
jgi:hypothetical protein